MTATPISNFDLLVEGLMKGTLKPILFLGAGCSTSAGLPTLAGLMKDIAGREVAPTEYAELGHFLSSSLKNHGFQRLQVRDKLLNDVTNTRAFDQLALLVSKGYFQTILTTNWDYLIETSLSRFFTPDQCRVYVRWEIPDENLAKMLNEPHPHVKVVKLHGDLQSPAIFQPEDRMRLGGQLETQLRQMIQSHGIVVIGYGLHERRFHVLLSGGVKPFIVDPVITEDLRQLGDGALGIDNEDGRFENFVRNLCQKLLGTKYREWYEDSKTHYQKGPVGSVTVTSRKAVDDKVEEITDRIASSNVAKERVVDLASGVLIQISKTFGKSVCLVFVRDPSAPGGEEIERLILTNEQLGAKARDMEFRWVQMNNRVTEKGPRKVVDWMKSDKQEQLNTFGAVVLFDAVTFTGNTLNVARRHLVAKQKVPEDKIAAAVLFAPPDTKKRLMNDRWRNVLSPTDMFCDGFEVTFPWGWTTATKHVPRRRGTSEFIPQDGFAYTPKPWGDQLTFSTGERCTVNLLALQRGQRTSTHYHLLRDETFIVLDDRMRMCVWDRYLELKKHESIRIPAGVPHSLIALDQPCRILEIATGPYDQMNDIVRLVDIYNRKLREDQSDDGIV